MSGPTSSSTTELPPILGRFRLLKRLGQGAQAEVWLAHDPRLDRDVAVKVLKRGQEAPPIDEALHEARIVSRLAHPNIVPVFEADVQDARIYMVFEYVQGLTLAERMRQDPPLSVQAAVAMMLEVLEALDTAHAARLVHRDLKPSNILLDSRGRPRVMDFGIAARMVETGAQPQRIVGTPGYISPEAAQGFPPSPQMDVFAVAVMLAELLSGQRLNHDPDPWRAVHRVINEELQLPTGLGPDVDDRLRAIVQRGLARYPSQRWPSARAFHEALSEWLYPSQPAEEAGADNATLEFLLRRMRLRSDFPAMSDAVSRVQRLTASENESLTSLSNEILKDVALTHKLLRLVNTAHFSHAGGGSISTVSRAVALVGFAGIRNLALSLILLERMENKTHAQQLRVEFLRSLMAGSLARELCLSAQDSEEAFLAAMFLNLGRMLAEFYFPEEAAQVRRMIRPEREGSAAPVSEAVAATRVLGISYEQLGLGVARSWGLPDSLVRCMLRPDGDAPNRAIERGPERQRWLTRAANDVADLILHTDPSEAHARVRAMAQRYSRALGVSAETFDAAATAARQKLSQIADAMDIHLPRSSPGLRLLAPLTPALNDSLSAHELQATVIHEPTLDERLVSRQQAAETLAAGIQDITNVMVENFKLNEVLRMILETIYRGLGFRRVIFCLRDPRQEMLTGRFGLGDGVEAVVPQFRVPLRLALSEQSDLFAAVCQKGVDTLIADATAEKIAQRLPAWFSGDVWAPSFLVLPLSLRGAPLGMIFADRQGPGGIDLDEKELSLLRTLRNQAVMAFKQAG